MSKRARSDAFGGFAKLSQLTQPTKDRRMHLDGHHLASLSKAFYANSTILACTRILEAGVLSGGITLMRNGQKVEFTSEFQAHLDEVWLEFARSVIVSTLKYGIVPVVLVKHDGLPFGLKAKDANVVPLVVSPLEHSVQCDVEGFKKTYYLVDEQGERVPDSHVFVKHHPTPDGLVTSAMSTLVDAIAFVGTLHECAARAEKVRSRYLVTTSVNEPGRDNPNIDSANMFFDQDSRALASDNDVHEHGRNLKSLELAASLAAELNRARNQSTGGGHGGGAGPSSAASALLRSRYDDLEVNPQLFAAPSGQSVVSGLRPPDARNDLVAIKHELDQQISTAFGVPASMLSDGAKFSANATAALRSFGTTLQELASYVNTVLSATYSRVYNLQDATERVVVKPAQTAALADVVALFTSKMASREVLIPHALQAIGASDEDVRGELVRAKAQDAADAEAARAEMEAKRATASAATATASQKAPAETADDDGKAKPPKKRAKHSVAAEGEAS